MEREEIGSAVVQIILDVLCTGSDESPKETDRFYYELKADSLDMFDIAHQMERDICISITDEDMAMFEDRELTVGGLVDFAYRKKQERYARYKNLL